MSCHLGICIVRDVCALSLMFVHMVETRRMHRYMFRKVDSVGFLVLYFGSRSGENQTNL
jgi:hypothetical protein